MFTTAFAAHLALLAIPAVPDQTTTPPREEPAVKERLRVQVDATEITLKQGERTVFHYRYTDVPFKPYVRALYSPAGVNVLQDAPTDHLHHHGLMFAVERLNGEPIDPFALGGEVSMWRRHNDPRPYDGAPAEGDAFEPSEWDPDGVEAAIDACRDREIREKARCFASLERRAAEILFHRVLSSAAFDAFPPLYKREGSRRPCLDLPFRKQDFHSAWLPGARPA